MADLLSTYVTTAGERVDIHRNGVALCLNCRVKFPHWEDVDELDHDCEDYYR